eukprot:gene9135-13595_t
MPAAESAANAAVSAAAAAGSPSSANKGAGARRGGMRTGLSSNDQLRGCRRTSQLRQPPGVARAMCAVRGPRRRPVNGNAAPPV